jgi:hypothetical protein
MSPRTQAFSLRASLTERNWKDVEAQYAANGPLHHVVIDDLIVPQACSELHRLLLDHPGWDLKNRNADPAHLAGRDAPELAAIGDAVRDVLPGLLGTMEVAEHWAFLHHRSCGIGAHFDVGAVTLNLWLTPDEHNLTPGRAGLILYGVEGPAHVSAQELQTPGWAEQYLAREHNGTAVQIAYRCNRAVLFRSALFHASDEGSFRASDPASSRTNLTLLFDDPDLYATRRKRFGHA